MSDQPPDFDLKLLPDWLKEPPSKNPYAHYEGEKSEKPRRDFSPSRPPRRDSRQKDPRKPGRGRADSKHRDHPSERDRFQPQPPAAPPEKAAPVSIELLPDPNCTLALGKQIKSSARAYPLFDLARMFLEKPDRHRVKITVTGEGATLFQCGENGPVALDRHPIEKNAFALSKHLFYAEETTQGEPPKGNYSNVARCRLSGVLLGPTNHHNYQPALRKLYEERFSRRISFAEYQREIEIVTAPEAIEAWKEQARTVTTFKTLQETEPVTFTSADEAERHFREHYLQKCLHSGNSFEISGEASRRLPDRAIAAAVRQAWEKETRFPGQVMNHLRREFIHAGLHIFKHRNRIQLVSAIRPTPFNEAQQSLSDAVAGILKIIAATPKCTRAELGAKILPLHQDDPVKAKAALAADLHWLIHEGHVIEFHNGILELPLPSKPDAKKPQEKGAPAKAEPESEIEEAPAAPPDATPPHPDTGTDERN